MTLVVLVLGAYRVTRLLNKDKITRPLWSRMPSRLVDGWFCPWCLGFWVSLVATLAWFRAINVEVVVTVFAVSAGVGLVTYLENLVDSAVTTLDEMGAGS